MDILGGQAIVAQRLAARLRSDPEIELSFVPHNPRLPGPLALLQRVKYVRTVVTSLAYVALLLLRLRKVDVVHVFAASYWSFLLAPTPAVLIGKWYRKRVLLNYHSGEAADHLSRWKRSVVPVLRRADSIVVPSAYLMDEFARFGFDAHAVFNFVDLEDFPYRERKRPGPRFLANRNFAPHYNVSCVLRAFRVIQDAFPDSRLTVAGDGEERALLEALVEKLALRNVRFVGQVSPSRMAELYAETDIYLNAPNVDNMPVSVLEAFAAGVPVVSTDAGGIPYLVADGVTGLLCAPDDHKCLGEKAIRLLREPKLGLKLSRRARQEVLSRYTWQAVHPAWRRAYGLAVRTTAPDNPTELTAADRERAALPHR